jgi:hypothetical protein
VRGLLRKAVALTFSLVLLATFAVPAQAQFEEEDTLPRVDVGIFFDLSFRGSRGEAGTAKIGFSNSPSGGLRVDYRLTGTLTIGIFGSYSSPKEKWDLLSGEAIIIQSHSKIYQLAGELLLRIKPRIPGYFILGGGVQYVDPPDDDTSLIGDAGSFTEPFGIAGAGYEFASTRRRAFRVNFRLHLINPSSQGNYQPKSISVDFVVGAAFILRF